MIATCASSVDLESIALIPTYAMTVNGRIHVEIKDGAWPVPHEVAGMLDRLDGVERFAVSLWALPVGKRLDDVKLDRWPVVYIQAAGNGDRMTVEVRREGLPGERHFVVGWSKTIESEPTAEISWDDHSTRVYKVEVFTAASAVPLFLTYMESGDLPPGYTQRALDL
jgi:hypothetical protein